LTILTFIDDPELPLLLLYHLSSRSLFAISWAMIGPLPPTLLLMIRFIFFRSLTPRASTEVDLKMKLEVAKGLDFKMKSEVTALL